MRKLLNTLFVINEDAYLILDCENPAFAFAVTVCE